MKRCKLELKAARFADIGANGLSIGEAKATALVRCTKKTDFETK